MPLHPGSPADVDLYTRVGGAANEMVRPYLTAAGFSPTPVSPSADEQLLYPSKVAERAAMFRRSLDFLRDAPLTGVVWPTVTSYSLKHSAERPDGYVENGVMILAMIHLGWDFKCDGPNAVLSVPEAIYRANAKAQDEGLD